MAKTAKDYPKGDPYGYSANYPGFHTGQDWETPWGTPLVVNGVQIGVTGNSGYVLPKPTSQNPKAGAHLHIGKYIGAQSYNPGSGGFSFKSAVVTQLGEDGRNGKFVRVQGDNYSWVYLHLSKQTCKVGQKLIPLTPKPTYPKWVKVVTLRGANVRSKPTTASPLAGSRYLPFGTPFRVAGIVAGQSINGNNKWYKSMYNNYVWSGNVK